MLKEVKKLAANAVDAYKDMRAGLTPEEYVQKRAKKRGEEATPSLEDQIDGIIYSAGRNLANDVTIVVKGKDLAGKEQSALKRVIKGADLATEVIPITGPLKRIKNVKTAITVAKTTREIKKTFKNSTKDKPSKD